MREIIEELKECSSTVWTEFKNVMMSYDANDTDTFWKNWYSKMCEIDGKYSGTACEKLQEHLWTGLTESLVEGMKKYGAEKANQ